MLKGSHVELQICATYPRFPVGGGCSTSASVEHVALSISVATDGSVEAEHDTGGGIYDRCRTHHHFLSFHPTSDSSSCWTGQLLSGCMVSSRQGFNTRSFKRLREGKSSHFALSFVIADRNFVSDFRNQTQKVRTGAPRAREHAPVNVVVLVVIVYSQTG